MVAPLKSKIPFRLGKFVLFVLLLLFLFSLLQLSSTGGGSFSTEWLDFMDVLDKNIGNAEKADYFQCKAVVNAVRTKSAYYKACSTPDCNRKVQDQGNGMYRCEKCNTDLPNFNYRLLLSVSWFFFRCKISKFAKMIFVF